MAHILRLSSVPFARTKNFLLKNIIYFYKMDLVTVKTFDSYFVAHIILGRLQSEGIECYLKDEATVTIDPILTKLIMISSFGIGLLVATALL